MTMMMDGMMDVKTVPGLPGTEVPYWMGDDLMRPEICVRNLSHACITRRSKLLSLRERGHTTPYFPYSDRYR